MKLTSAHILHMWNLEIHMEDGHLLGQRLCLGQNSDGGQVLRVRDVSSGADPIPLILYS